MLRIFKRKQRNGATNGSSGNHVVESGTADNRAMIAQLDERIRQNPDNADAYFDRGAAHSHLEEFENAIADCDEAIRLNPNNAAVYLLRGTAHHRLDHYEKAIADSS